MTEDELNLWKHYRQQDEEAHKELILLYLPLVDVLAKRIARTTGANWEDLRQEGAFGLMKAIARFDPGHGVPFRFFAKPYICGAIYDSSEITRDMARRQDEIYRKLRQAEAELTQTYERTPTAEEVADKAGLTVEQVRNAIDARGVAFAGPLPDAESPAAAGLIESPGPERTIFLREALAHLNAREQQIIDFYYWQGQPHEEIAGHLGLTVSNVTKIRQRAIGKLRKRLDEWEGGQDEDRRPGE
jgi:RNA polymerase sigma factor (sigma-70 family)